MQLSLPFMDTPRCSYTGCNALLNPMDLHYGSDKKPYCHAFCYEDMLYRKEADRGNHS